MKRFLIFVVLFILIGCSSESIDLSLEQTPTLKQGEATALELKAEQGGQAITNLEIIGSLEMAKMDHGTIEVVFTDNGDGIYTGEVELPMGGEWIMDVQIEQDGEVTSEMLEFVVNEG